MGLHNGCVSPRTVSDVLLPPYITDRLGSRNTKLVPLHTHLLFFLAEVEEAERTTAVSHRLGKNKLAVGPGNDACLFAKSILIDGDDLGIAQYVESEGIKAAHVA